MITDKNTKATVFLLPLLFPDLKGYIFKNSSFINAYTNDNHMPSLDNHIFLLFENNPSKKIRLWRGPVDNKCTKYLYQELIKHDDFHSTYQCKIKNVDYTIFAFKINNSSYVQMLMNLFNLGMYFNFPYDEKLKILNYWKADANTKLHKYLFEPDKERPKPLGENITTD